jgi:cytochrome c-type biogenesis protein CcmH
MSLWFILALMTAAAAFAVLWPLSRRGAVIRSGSDLAVYRDQLEEIVRDRDSGRIGEAEAEAARVEVSRRLLAAADAAEAREKAAGSVGVWRRRLVALAALALLPIGASALYLTFGSPTIPGEPIAGRFNAPTERRSLAGMVAQVEAHLEKNPEDGQGWEVIAPIYLRLGRFDDAVKARGHALRILGADAEREADFGEALAAAANGIVTADAKAAFERSVKLDPKEYKARFFLGIAAEQDGRREDAAKIWRDLLADAPADAPWIAQVRSSIARVSGAPAAPPARGPSADDIKAAEQLTPEQRSEMIRGMVEGLAERLKSDGSDVESWQRLLRAYMVLGDKDKARSVAEDARRALAGDAGKLRQIDDFVKELGLGG